MTKNKSEKGQLFKILVDGSEENFGDEFNEVCDDTSDSEVEHISDASEDDDDELSCDADDIPLIYLMNHCDKRKYIVRGTNVRLEKREVINTRAKVVKIVRKKSTVNRNVKVVRRKCPSRPSVKVINVTKKLKTSGSASSEGTTFISKDETK